MTSWDREAGPIVQTSFVLCGSTDTTISRGELTPTDARWRRKLMMHRPKVGLEIFRVMPGHQDSLIPRLGDIGR